MSNSRAIAETLATYRWSLLCGFALFYVGYAVGTSLR